MTNKFQKNVEGIEGLYSCPYVPYDPDGRYLYSTYLGSPHGNGVQPWEYTGWRDECNSWHETSYVHSNLNPHPTHIIRGPEVMKLVSDNCVNTVQNWPVGKGKHLILCNEDGIVINDGIAVRIAEDAIKTHELLCLAYAAEKGKYDVTVKNVTYEECVFQFCGPKSLEVVENTIKEDIHDLEFMYARKCKVLGHEVGILRAGMAGSLGYEIHCQVPDAIEIYNEIIRVGEAYGLRKLGSRAYAMTHFEGGFPQWSLDFLSPWGGDEGMMEFLMKNGLPGWGPAGALWGNQYTQFKGSIGPDVKKRLRNPVELGWAGMIKFDHDFIGRKALEKIKANPKRMMVTLEWNVEDILDVHRSQFEPGERYLEMDDPIDFRYEGVYSYHADKVLKDGKEIGISTGRMNSYYYRKMISLCSIDVEYGALGTEVVVLWGNPGCRQKEIRAVVARFPYLQEDRNQTFDVNKIPRYTGK